MTHNLPICQSQLDLSVSHFMAHASLAKIMITELCSGNNFIMAISTHSVSFVTPIYVASVSQNCDYTNFYSADLTPGRFHK